MKDYSGFSDLELIDETRKGSNEAFSVLVSRYQDQVGKTVIGMLGNCMEAEDVGQETFIRFYRSIKDFRGESGLSTYLTRIALNLSLNELKKRKRNYSLYFSQDGEEKELNIAQPDDMESATDTKEIVQKVLQTLPAKFRSVVVLRMIDGYSTKETAEILNLPIGTVLSRLARAQRSLKEKLGKLI